MPLLSRYFIRSSLVYLLTGVTIGSLMLIDKGFPLPFSVRFLLPAHIEIMLMGWMLQLVMGTAYWILPKHFTLHSRGHPFPSWSSWILLNAGIMLSITLNYIAMPSYLEAVSRLLQLGGVACFMFVIYPRILTYRKEQ